MAQDYEGEGDAEFMNFMRSFVPTLAPEVQEAATVLGIRSSPTSQNNVDMGEGDYRSGNNAGPEKSFFDRLSDDVSQAWDKNPLEGLKMGAGAIGGAYTAEETRKAAALRAQNMLDQQNNADALRQAETSRYNASFNSAKRVAAAKKPLTRINGTQIFQNGIIKG
jgi:hypothetical protein